MASCNLIKVRGFVSSNYPCGEKLRKKKCRLITDSFPTTITLQITVLWACKIPEELLYRWQGGGWGFCCSPLCWAWVPQSPCTERWQCTEQLPPLRSSSVRPGRTCPGSQGTPVLASSKSSFFIKFPLNKSFLAHHLLPARNPTKKQPGRRFSWCELKHGYREQGEAADNYNIWRQSNHV